jgi:BlaI family transcriptional regulator, penicillinase repressor
MKNPLSIFTSKPQVGPFEREIMQRLWTLGSATVKEIHTAADVRQAYTTIMTTMDRLYKKGLLDRVAEGRAFRYTPRQSPEEFQRSTALESIRQLLGSAAPSSLPLSYLVDAVGSHDAQRLDELQLLVEKKRRELKNRDQKSGTRPESR